MRARGVRQVVACAVALAMMPMWLEARAQNPTRCPSQRMTFGAPVDLGIGFEPGIDVDSVGTIFVTAASGGGDLGASSVWRSVDRGRTFTLLPGLDGPAQSLDGFEGDVAVDGHDRLYYVDTWVGDSHVYRFSDRGGRLDFTRPAVATPNMDDRPWLAAHHDGDVYYVSNAADFIIGRQAVYRSEDGAETFEPVGYRVPNSGYAFIDADPRSDHVYVSVSDDHLRGPGSAPTAVWVSASPDRGKTWTQTKVADFDSSAFRYGFGPIVAVSPSDGVVNVVWNEGRGDDDESDRLRLARSKDRGRTWELFDITPFAGRIGFPWVSASPRGHVGIVLSGAPTGQDEYSVYAVVWSERGRCASRGQTCDRPAMQVARVAPDSSADPAWQRDYLQAEFTPDGALNVPFTRPGGPPRRTAFVRQRSGPNISGGPLCAPARPQNGP